MKRKTPKEVIIRNRELINGLQPSVVFNHFADISAIPRGSGNMKDIGDFLAAFAGKRGLQCIRDDVSNIVIRKPAQHCRAGGGVILQAHQDMVCVKEAGSPHDFLRDPIEFVRDGAALRANGTTLGADNGVGVAMALAVLDDSDMTHPPLEALFTVDEETDMKGAKAVRADMLRGEHLINIDSEDLGLAFVSSAAGCGMRLDIPVRRLGDATGYPVVREVGVGGLAGGHSGVQINAGLGNAFVLLARVLADVADHVDLGLLTFDMAPDRGADNAIPARAVARVALRSEKDAAELDGHAARWTGILRHEYRISDAGATVSCRAAAGDGLTPLTAESRDVLLRTVRLLPLGVFRFVQDAALLTGTAYKDLLVETSCNLGVVRLEGNMARLEPLARGSVPSVLDDLTRRISDLCLMAGGTWSVTNRTAGWEMAAEKPLVQRLFEEMPGMQWELVGVHAGLECGCLVETFARAGRELYAVSVGPTIRYPHSPMELLETDTVQPMWESLTAVLKGLANA